MQQTGEISPPDISLHFIESVSRTHYILKELREVGPAGQKVDFLYDFMKISVSSMKLTLC